MSNKSIQDARYQAMIEALRNARLGASITQLELASALGRSQQYVSKYESLERRLDVVEFIDVAQALELDWAELIVQSVKV